VVLAEHYISSSLAALLVATTPFWMVLIGWVFMGAGRPNLKVVGGLALGFLGVYLLIAGGEAGPAGSHDGQLLGIALIMFATLGWSIGSLYGTRAPTAGSPILAAALQMLSGGVVLLIVGTLAGEWSALDIGAVSLNSWLAFAYLVLFGALVAYTAYSWLLRNASPTAISTYAYVNPAIAGALGWAIAGETLTGQMMVGAAVIVASVALITLNKSKPAEQEEKEIHTSAIPRAGLSTAR
jgi:drug/metabolite transporter (DMT)-like permease